MKGAFTLLETLAVVAVVALLFAVVVPTTTRVNQYAARVKAVSNLRQLGVAAHLYANDHNQELPGRPAPGADGTWPQLLCQYLSPSDPRVLLDPQDRQTAKLPPDTVLSPATNNTGYLYNGFDDLAPEGEAPSVIPLNRLQAPSQIILLAPKAQGATGFYVDVLLKPIVDLLNQFNPVVYDGGAHYLFVDGSVRFLKQAEYSNSFWLSDKSITLPPLPDLPLSQSPSSFAGPSGAALSRAVFLGDASWRRNGRAQAVR